jgi:hypothetical protein
MSELLTARLFKRTATTPDDILNSLNHIETSEMAALSLRGGALSPKTFLDWANEGLARECDEGYAAAATNAKKAACARIDELLRERLIHRALTRNVSYPERIRILDQMGITYGEIVHDVVIEPRNLEEHEYARPDRGRSRMATQLAKLFLQATKEDVSGAPVFIGQTLAPLAGPFVLSDADKYEFKGFPPEPFAFVNVLTDHVTVNVVFPAHQEITHCRLNALSLKQQMQLPPLLAQRPMTKSVGYPRTSRSTNDIDLISRIIELAEL